ncbi:MAG: aspartyl protease [Gammaproteobacteria bacterium]|nr:MAG: aspartyl protease [Gammaproteobacteria bacterium]RKZ77001.1 MAG: aspartyl protease [Gammaproteobacteria bacterium]
MIRGNINSQGELFFEMGLIASDKSVMFTHAILDTGFTDWIAMNIQDVESLGWAFIKTQKKYTANGIIEFNLYAGTVFFDEQEFAIEVIGGNEFTHVLMGLQWLKHRRLIVDRKMDRLTLENVN